MLAHRHDGSARQTPPEMRIPEGLTDVIGKRLSRLSSEANGVLSVAAVVGRDFRLDVLQKVAGLSEEDVFAALEEAQAAAVIEERSATGTGVGFRFAHAFFKQTLYEETFAPRRIRLHQQVGRALEEAYTDRLDEHAAELTEHFAQSTEREDLQKALSYGEMAAERAMSVFAYGEAVRLLEQALLVQEVLDPGDKAKRCDLLLALGLAVVPAGDPLRAAEAVAPEAFALANAFGDDRRGSAASRLGLSGLLRYGAGAALTTPEYRIWAERADRLAAPKTAERVFADSALAWLEFGNPRSTEFSVLADRALELARKLDDPQMLWLAAAPNVYAVAWPPRHLEGRIRLAREVAEWPRELGDLAYLPWTLHFCAFLLFAAGDREGAEALWEEVGQIAERTRDTTPRLLTLHRKNLRLFVDGRLEESLQGIERFVDRAEELGSPAMGRLLGAWQFKPLLYLGRAEEALAATGYELGPLVPAAPAICLAHVGRLPEAREALHAHLHAIEDETAKGGTRLGVISLTLELAVTLADRDAAAGLATTLAGHEKYAPILFGSSDGRNLGGQRRWSGTMRALALTTRRRWRCWRRSATAPRWLSPAWS